MQLEGADLNLLKALDVLLQERHITRAAERSHLSQPAMSRTLARLRRTFGDELLVRTADGYELTPRARVLQAELADLMPQITAMLGGGEFDPVEATGTIRMACTDYVTSVLGPTLFPAVFEAAPHLSVTVDPLSPETFSHIDRGRLDLALTPVTPPRPFRWHDIFEETFVGVVSADHPVARRRRLSLADLSDHGHARVVALPIDQMLVERRLAAHGVAAPSALSVPYFTAAIGAVRGTDLIAVLPRRFAALHRHDPGICIVETPTELGAFSYGITWHPRLTADPSHAWFRNTVIAAAAALPSR